MIRLESTDKHIHLLRTIPDFAYQLQLWSVDEDPLLFLTGLSGCGKTTASAFLAKQYGVIAISLDVLRFYDSASDESKCALDEFLCQYPHIAPLVKNHWPVHGFFRANERAYTKHIQLFVRFLDNRARRKRQRYILEGIQPFARMPCSLLSQRPKIILGTSILQCFQRAARREFATITPRLFPILLNRFFRYYVWQGFRLNHFISEWERQELVHLYHLPESTID